MKKYQNIDLLRDVWGQPEIDENNIQLPHPNLRKNCTDFLRSLFKANPGDLRLFFDFE